MRMVSGSVGVSNNQRSVCSRTTRSHKFELRVDRQHANRFSSTKRSNSASIWLTFLQVVTILISTLELVLHIK